MLTIMTLNDHCPLKVVFHLDGTGVFYDPHEPYHLDGLIGWCLAYKQGLELTASSDVPQELQLPLTIWRDGNLWGWCASALFPEGESAETIQFFRKRFRQEHATEWCGGNVNTQAGPYKTYNKPGQMILCQRMVAYCHGNKGKLLEAMRDLKYIGKFRSAGKGMILGIDIEKVDYDWSLLKAGYAQRYLPQADGPRIVRTRPPYWNMHDKAQCCNVGDQYET